MRLLAFGHVFLADRGLITLEMMRRLVNYNFWVLLTQQRPGLLVLWTRVPDYWMLANQHLPEVVLAAFCFIFSLGEKPILLEFADRIWLLALNPT